MAVLVTRAAGGKRILSVAQEVIGKTNRRESDNNWTPSNFFLKESTGFINVLINAVGSLAIQIHTYKSKKEEKVRNRKEESPERVDDFLKRLPKIKIRKPDSKRDFGMYERMDKAFEGLHEHLKYLMRNQGRIGYASVNAMSDYQHAYIEAVVENNEEEMAHMEYAMLQIEEGLVEREDEIAESGNRFSRLTWQEGGEGRLVGKIFPIIIGKKNQIPKLMTWQEFREKGGNVQAFVYQYIDVVTELSKELTAEIWRKNRNGPPLTDEEEKILIERFIDVADSIRLRLSQERHFPDYVIGNSFGKFSRHNSRIRGVEICILRARDTYNELCRKTRI